MATVYLETSFMAACVTKKTDVDSAHRRWVSVGWWRRQRSKHTLVISEDVVRGLNTLGELDRQEALRLIESLPLLAVNDDAGSLASVLVREQVIPAPDETDLAMHVATATVHRCDYMLSWNRRHLMNLRNAAQLELVCGREGYVPPKIVTPDLLWEYDDNVVEDDSYDGTSPIVEEVRAIRRQIVEEAGGTVEGLCEYLRCCEFEHPKRLVEPGQLRSIERGKGADSTGSAQESA